MNIRKIIAIVLLVASLILAVVCCFALPDTVISQISLSGSDPSTMPKWGAILLPTFLGAGFALAALKEKDNVSNYAKYIFVSAVGIVIFIFSLVVNC